MSILDDLHQKLTDAVHALNDKVLGLSTAEKQSATDLADAQAAAAAAAEVANNLAAELEAQKKATEAAEAGAAQESEASADVLNEQEAEKH